MRFVRLFFLFCISSSLLILGNISWAIGPGTSLFSSSGGGCSGVNFAGGDSSNGTEDSGSDNGSSRLFETGAPVDIPAPIAKAINGVDATSIRFTENGPSQSVMPRLKKSTDGEDSLIGEITGNLLDQTDCSSKSVGVIIDSSFTDQIAVQSCSFSYPVTATKLAKPIAFVVAQATLIEEGTEVSAPVIVTISPVASGSTLFPNKNYTLNVSVTNTDIDTQEVAADIKDSKISVSPEGLVAFTASDNSGNFVGTVDIRGGLNEVLATTTNLMSALTFTSQSDLIGADSVTQALYEISALGANGLSFPPLSPEAFFAVHPSGDYMAVNTLSEGHTYIKIINMSGSLVLGSLDLGANVTSVSLAWASGTELMVFAQTDNNPTTAALYDVSPNLAETTTSFTSPLVSFSSQYYMGNPIFDHAGQDRFAYECADNAGNSRLCIDSLSNAQGPSGNGVMVTGGIFQNGVQVSNPYFSADYSSYILFDLTHNAERAVCIYKFSDQSIDCQASGYRSAPMPQDTNTIAYICNDVTGAKQICVHYFQFNVANDPLSLPSVTVSVGNEVTLKPVGGSPTYSFSLSGSGALNTSTGIYQAPNSATTVTATVTDRTGQTASAQIHVVNPGVLDPSFSADGVVSTDLLTATMSVKQNMTVQSDRKVVTVGFTLVNGQPAFGVTRFKKDGSLDSSFGTNGLATVEFNVPSVAQLVAIQPDKKILVAGFTSTLPGPVYDWVVARLNADGTPDTSFGTGGKMNVNLVNSGYVYGLSLQENGKILLAGASSNNFNGDSALVRLNTDGSLDSDFGNNGQVILDLAGLAGFSDFFMLALETQDDKILAVGTSVTDMGAAIFDITLTRLNSNGSVDNTFGINGSVKTDLSSMDLVYNMAVQPDGKTLVCGYYNEPISGDNQAFLLRYKTDGSLDNTFGTNGVVQMAVGGAGESHFDTILLQEDGKILVSGEADSMDIFIARFDSSGTLDLTFDTDGFLPVDADGDGNLGPNVLAQGIFFDEDGKIVGVGTAPGTTYVFRVLP